MRDFSTKLSGLTQAQLETWVAQARSRTRLGQLPSYIPLLSKVDPGWVAIWVQEVNGQIWSAGELQQSFALMSVVKPLMLLFLLEQLGSEVVFAKVGMDPSDQPFHSIAQLKADQCFPRNPMLNSGAIALASLLPGKDGFSRCEALRQWLNHLSGSRLVLDEAMLASVRSVGNEVNRTLANLLHQLSDADSIDITLDTYNHVCCLSGTVEDLAHLGLLLAQPRNHPSPVHRQAVNALMLTCGLYETSGRFAVHVGLPTKSGVSGALLSVVPGQGAIACYSPPLDLAGNSVAGLFLLEQLTQTLNLSVFS